MVFVHAHRTHDDIDFRILDLVERLAGEFEGDLGIRPIVDQVQQARDWLRLEELDEADHLDTLESLAHDALARLAARDGCRPRSSRPLRTPREDKEGAAERRSWGAGRRTG